MKRYTNIEELKELIPDYITGNIDEKDKQKLESAMNESLELRDLYNEIIGTLAFVSGAKFAEPSPQYFNTLLPRIHERIQQKEESRFSWDKIPVIWKMFLPVAAVILIAVVYYLVKPTDTQVTRDDKKIENINKDTNKNQNNNQDNKTPQNDKESIVNEQDKEKQNKNTEHRKNYKSGNIVKQGTPIDSNHADSEDIKDDYTSIDDESSPFSTGEGAGLDYESELDELTDTEQNTLLKQLEKSNL